MSAIPPGEATRLPEGTNVENCDVTSTESRRCGRVEQPQCFVTTEQAADLLGVSRPTVIRLLDGGKVPYERAGDAHRRILLKNLLDYREQRRAAQYAALEATAVSIEDEDDLEITLAELRAVRREIAAERRRLPS